VQHLDYRRKILFRVNAPGRVLVNMLRRALGKVGRVVLSAAQVKVHVDTLKRNREKELVDDRAQWRRWYQVNRRRQRQLKALSRMGVKIDPRSYSLARWLVP
jgi:hypothetical protein